MKRFSAEEKGKSTLPDLPEQRRMRIKAPELDTSALIQDNFLTLIGRLTNPREQNMTAVLPYLTRKWNLVGQIHGSDLGNHCFQFRFQDEKEMKKVLDNRLYQVGRWMIILQRWEPIISPTFPSQIPFWITLRGIPLHFWHERVIMDIGQELGELDHYILTKTSARARVFIDGLKPLPQDTVLEFSSGEECIVTFSYEKLENFCSYCLKLTHLESYCPDKCQRTSELLDVDVPTQSQRENNEQRVHVNDNHYQRPPFSSENAEGSGHFKGERTEFKQRLDRHGKPFGERVSSNLQRGLPLRNKITPAMETGRGNNEPIRRDLPVRNSYTSTSPAQPLVRGEDPRYHGERRRKKSPEYQWRRLEREHSEAIPTANRESEQEHPVQHRPPPTRTQFRLSGFSTAASSPGSIN